MTNQDPYVLITGASSGIGLELAWEFARNGHSLVLTATNEEELNGIANAIIEEHRIEVLIVAVDLLQPLATQRLYNAVKSAHLPIEILVNNAGIGQKGQFWEQSLQSQVEMIRLNAEIVTTLTRLFLPEMLARGHGRILNTASTAGFIPAPLMAVYHATKAFVLSFSEALATELKDTGVTLTTLCPGATDTDFFPRSGAVNTVMFQKGNVMAPEEVAEGAYRALMCGDRVYVPGGMNKVMVFSRRFLPESFLAKMSEAVYRDVQPENCQRKPGDIAKVAPPRITFASSLKGPHE